MSESSEEKNVNITVKHSFAHYLGTNGVVIMYHERKLLF